MEQRLSLVSLGVRDLKISRDFYENLNWAASKSTSNDQITAFQLGGITLAHNARLKEQVENLLIEAVTAERFYSNWWKKFLGRLFRIVF